MSIPVAIDQKIRARLDELIQEASDLINKMEQDNREYHARNRNSIVTGKIHNQKTAFHALVIKFVSLIELMLGNSPRAVDIINEVRGLTSKSYSTEQILGILKGLRSDYENGMLTSLHNMLEANIISDYMNLAEQLLGEGISGQYDYVPAAVLAGAVLENGLRKLCDRQQPPIPLSKENGQPKTMGGLIDDLKKAGLYNELKAKQLRSWADTRNAAAHGKFDDFTRQDVEQMLLGIQNFLADYM